MSLFSVPRFIFLNLCLCVFLAKCLSMRETKGIVVNSAPQASMGQWLFGTSRYKHTLTQVSSHLFKHGTALIIVFAPLQSLEASIQGLRIMWRKRVTEWRDAAASLPNHALTFDLPRPRSYHLTPPPATQPVTYITDHLIECLLKHWSDHDTLLWVCANTLIHTHTYTHRLTCDITVDLFCSCF